MSHRFAGALKIAFLQLVLQPSGHCHLFGPVIQLGASRGCRLKYFYYVPAADLLKAPCMSIMGKFLDIILIVLIVRTILSMVFPRHKQKSAPAPAAPVPKPDEERFGKKADIVDGDFVELK